MDALRRGPGPAESDVGLFLAVQAEPGDDQHAHLTEPGGEVALVHVAQPYVRALIRRRVSP